MINEKFETQVYFGDTIQQIEELTHLTEDELWKLGFNLDDMDCWVAIPNNLIKVVKLVDDWGTRYEVVDTYYESGRGEGTPFWLHLLIEDWNSYCVGYSVTPYEDLVFLTLHHA